MNITKEDIILQEQIESVCESVKSEEECAQALLQLDIKPEQVWLLQRAFSTLKIYNLVRDSDMLNLLSNFLDKMSYLDTKRKHQYLQERINSLLAELHVKQKERQEESKTVVHDIDSLTVFDSIEESLGRSLEQARFDLRIERLGKMQSELDLIHQDSKRCEKGIRLCQELIRSFEERISENDKKKEKLKNEKRKHKLP